MKTIQSFVTVFILAIAVISCQQELPDNNKDNNTSGNNTSILQATCKTVGATSIEKESAKLTGSCRISNAESSYALANFYYSSSESDSVSLAKKGVRVYADSISSNGGDFSSVIQGLSPSKTYYYIAAITIDGKEFLGEVRSFNTKENSTSETEDISFLYGVYSCKSFRAFEWDDGAFYYDFDVTISKKNENDRTVWLSNIDPILKENDFADYENRVYGTVDLQSKTITVPSGQKLYKIYYFQNAYSDDSINISIQNDGKKLVFRSTWGLYVNDDDPGWIEVYPAGLTLSRESSQEGNVPVTGISLEQTTTSMTVGETLTLTAIVSPSNATNKNVSWSSDAPSIASVSSSGVVTAKAKGTAIITATTADGGYKSSCEITVSDVYIAVTGISLNHTSLVIEEESEVTLAATVYPSNATNKKIIWSSSNTSFVTVNQDGTVKGIKSGGTAVITATAEDDMYKTAYCTVTVTLKNYDKSALSGEASNISCRNVKISGTIPEELGDIPNDASVNIYIRSVDDVFYTNATVPVRSDRSFEYVNNDRGLIPGKEYYYAGTLRSSEKNWNEAGTRKYFTTPALSTMIETYDATNISYSGATFNAKLDLTNCVYKKMVCGFEITSLDNTSIIGSYVITSENSEDLSVDLVNNSFSLRKMLLPGTRYKITAFVRFWLEGNHNYNYDESHEADSKVFSTTTSPEIIDLGLSVKWRAWDLGASKPEENGLLYAWGEVETKKDYSWNNYKWGDYYELTKYNSDKYYGVVDNKTDLKDYNYEDDVARHVLGNKWRIPTLSECNELIRSCSFSSAKINGKNIYLVKSNINNEFILLPSNSSYWLSSLFNYHYAYIFKAEGSTGYESRDEGLPIRPVKE